MFLSGSDRTVQQIWKQKIPLQLILYQNTSQRTNDNIVTNPEPSDTDTPHLLFIRSEQNSAKLNDKPGRNRNRYVE